MRLRIKPPQKICLTVAEIAALPEFKNTKLFGPSKKGFGARFGTNLKVAALGGENGIEIQTTTT